MLAEQKAGSYSTKYRFTGKEVDEETGLYYFGARYYDPRISLWYGVDPMAEKYPQFGAFVFTANNPITYKDPNGKEIIIGEEGYIFVPGKDYQGEDKFVSETDKALQLLYKHKNLGQMNEKGGNVFDFVGNKDKNVNITNAEDPNGNSNVPYGNVDYTDDKGTKIMFDTKTGIKVNALSATDKKNPNSSLNKEGTISPAILLVHELAHAWLTPFDPEQKITWDQSLNMDLLLM
ncbi:MAG: RHS repeat-associated core domain-containing protein [Saprospiraceae bacterium]|nr:RHS repeat-associated core domain-containing protein [Candidatus Defluviibacterium haderslevense]MBK7243843.1 RHS repeat-associated core domain-containing protein [Candidatus Defluviibacterium haderslevense]